MLDLLAEDTYRMKGFLVCSDGTYLADCVGTDIRLTPYTGKMKNENRLTLLAGEGMPLRRAIRQLMQEYGALVIWQKERDDA